MNDLVRSLQGRLIVSCQALPDNPLHGPAYMAVMAQAAERGGAAAIRANGPADIRAIKAATALPVIGINKHPPDFAKVYITPDFASAAQVAAAGADLIALDATDRPRPGGVALAELVARIRNDLKLPVMADISTFEEGVAAAALDADIVATTLSGYTPATQERQALGPDFELLGRLAAALDVPVICEGRLWTVEHVREAFRHGAHAVVIGKAITDPMAITRRIVAGIEEP